MTPGSWELLPALLAGGCRLVVRVGGSRSVGKATQVGLVVALLSFFRAGPARHDGAHLLSQYSGG